MQNYTKGEIHLPEKTEIKDMSLHEKLAGIRKIVEVVQKNKEGHNYKYAGEETILAKVIAGMDRVRRQPLLGDCSRNDDAHAVFLHESQGAQGRRHI